MDLSHGIPVSIHLETYVTQEGETEEHVFNEPGTIVELNDTIVKSMKKNTRIIQ